MAEVLVTGGSRGIGLAIVQRLAAAGYGVIALARKQSPELTAAMEAAPGRVRFLAYDLSNLEGIPKLAADIGPLYGLVNNAGLATDGLLADLDDARIETVIRVNVTAPILLTKHLVRGMSGGGRIVNMSSITAHAGFNGLAVYAATKASMVGFTRSLAREVGRQGVTVNAIAPGFLETDMTAGMAGGPLDQIRSRSALKRLADVDDVAAAVEFLMGEGGRNITGAVMTIDAGNTA
jgi:3-oxoacyl-[acyl-carrier protein] reductase